jgi:hypothetical protein
VKNKIIAGVLVFVSAIATLVVVTPEPVNSAPKAALTRSDVWRGRAITALNTFNNGPAPTQMKSFGYGAALGASANLYGWTDPGTQSLLTSLHNTRNPDGTYGIGYAFDAFQNGSTNPATTAYAVTMAGHVGPTLLDGYLKGAIPASEIQSLVNKLVNFPKVTVSRGQCVAYSNSGTDSTYCVHNVNAGVAWFLQDANAAGFSATGLQRLITDISIQEGVSYREGQYFWPYSNANTTVNQDPDHNSYSAESIVRMQYWVGREAIFNMMTHTYASDPIVHTRLTAAPGGIGSQSGTTTLWCVYGDNFDSEQNSYMNSVTGNDAAQFAYYASRDAIVCQ